MAALLSALGEVSDAEARELEAAAGAAVSRSPSASVRQAGARLAEAIAGACIGDASLHKGCPRL